MSLRRYISGGRTIAMLGLNIGGGDDASLYREGALGEAVQVDSPIRLTLGLKALG